ncbi:MAG: BlaI/MecI/CopY family transcriptional regulator [Solirubrobacteraceae bacterium]
MSTRRPSKSVPALHALEAEIMEVVWRQGKTTVKRVMEALNDSASSPRAYTTFMTVMQRLDQKGLLSRTRIGRSDTYVPRLSREEYHERRAREQIVQLVQEYGDLALSHFARELSALDPARLRQLRSLARGER